MYQDDQNEYQNGPQEGDLQGDNLQEGDLPESGMQESDPQEDNLQEGGPQESNSQEDDLQDGLWRQEPDRQADAVRTAGKKHKKGGRIAIALILAAVFIGFCGGISWMAVSSLQEQLAEASKQPQQEPQEQETLERREEQESQEERESQEEQKGPEEQKDPEKTQPQGETAQIDPVPSMQPAGTPDGATVVTDVTAVVKNVMPACVSITNNFTQRVQDFWGQTYSRDAQGSGSGIIIGQNETELLIVSNNHVVDSADSLQVQFIDGEIVEAQVKGTDPTVDLAVVAVKLEDIPESTRGSIVVAKMGDSENLTIGEPAIAIGNALGYGQSVTTGVISALNRTLEVSETGESSTMIQTDAAINPGNSGGALLNIRGEVIGINSSKTYGSAIEGMGYAIPISTAKPIIDELMTYETRSRFTDEERGYLGISCINVTSDISQYYDIPEGVFVAQVYEGTGADQAGLIRGDIVTAVEGVEVETKEGLNRQLSYYEAGETVEVTIMQGSPVGYQAKNVQITLSSYDQIQSAQSRQEEDAGQNGWQSGSLWP